MNNTASNFLSFALIVLAVVAGAYAWHHWIEKPRIITKIEWFERQVVIPPKVESKPGIISPPSSETARRDTIILTAPCDSLRELAQRLTGPFESFFVDSIAVSDSLGSFFAFELTTAQADPWTRIITKTRIFSDAILKLSRVETTETVTEIDWLVTAGAFIAGLLLALLAAK
jgi:hypothetical protein